jgi:hypothetical protein
VTDRRLHRAAASLLFACLSGCLNLAHAAGPHFACGYEDNDPAVEAQHIAASAQGVVRRDSRHVLSVRTAQGVLRLTDKPPHDQPLNGVHYHFCDRRDGYTLVLVEDGADFNGVLIDEASGKTTEAGPEVLFSNDRRAYFAETAPDGLDGQVWTIRAADGTKSWSGYSFIEHAKGYFDILLDTPAWTDTGEFTAMARCVSDEQLRWKVKLTKAGGRWQWLPQRTCPKS